MAADGDFRAAVAAPRADARLTGRDIVTLILIADYFLLIAWLYRDSYMDDAYIGFRYVANLLAGNGLVFNPPDAIEGVTNLGWLLLIVPPALVLPVPLAAKLTGLVLMGVTTLLILAASRFMARHADRSDGLAWLPLVVIVTLATHDAFVIFSLLGMETAALAAIFAAMLLLATRDGCAGALAPLGVLAFLVRPEAVLVYPVYAAVAAARGLEPRRSVTQGLLIFVGGAAIITAARWWYFGDVVPNTFASKSSGFWHIAANLVTWVDGSSVNIAFPFAGLLAMLVLLAGALHLWQNLTRAAAMALSITTVGILFANYALPDWTRLGRYFAPYVPVAAIVFWFGVATLARAAASLVAPARIGVLVGGPMAAAIAVTGISHTIAHTTDTARQTAPGYILTSETLVAPSLWMRDNLPAGATIATRRIGALGYLTDLPIFDYTFGLTERDVARAARAQHRHFADPNDPALAAAWAARRPQYLLEDNEVIDAIAAASGGSRERFRIHGDDYRVIRSFPIARNVAWTLAQRIENAR